MNEECYPTCVYCYAMLVEVPSVPAADPHHEEHEQRAILADRYRRNRRQLFSAGLLYALAVTVLAAVPGLVFDPVALVLYFVGGLVVGSLVGCGLGRASATLLQGVFSVVLMFSFGPMQPFIFFMLVGHLTGPAILWHWVEMIQSIHR